MAGKLETIINTPQEQRSMLLTKNLGDGAATEAIAQKDARIEQLKEELSKVARESEARRIELMKRDTELRKAREDMKKLKDSETAAVAAAKKSAADMELKVAEARARAEREMATAGRNAPIVNPGRTQSSDEMIRKIAMLNSKSLHLEAENERYKRLYDQIEVEVTKLRKQVKENAKAAAASAAAAAAPTAAEAVAPKATPATTTVVTAEAAEAPKDAPAATPSTAPAEAVEAPKATSPPAETEPKKATSPAASATSAGAAAPPANTEASNDVSMGDNEDVDTTSIDLN